jgi:hypothetical protein
MRRIKLLPLVVAPLLLLSAGASAQERNCNALIATSTRTHGSEMVIRVRNISKEPIVAYVIRSTPEDAGDFKTYSLHGVFTDGDSLNSGKAIVAGKLPRRTSQGLLQVDFVRLANGSTCGEAATEDARQIAARFR